MYVHQILKEKSDDGVVTIPGDKSVADVAALLAQRKIGAVVVSDDGRVAQGILSERDIVRGLGQRGAAVLTERVADLMTKDPVTCTPKDGAESVMSRMTEGRFRHLPVVEDGQLVGLISIGDVVKVRLSELRHETEALTDMIMGR